MTTLHRSRNWKIEVFGREHGIPHVHVSGPDFRATVDILTGDIIAGKLPTTTLKEVRRWLGVNRELALEIWKLRNPNI